MEDQLIEEGPHLEAARGAVGMESPPKVSNAVRANKTNAAPCCVVHIVLIIAAVDLRGACGVDVKVWVQFLRADVKGANARASGGGERVAQDGRGRHATFVVGCERREAEQERRGGTPMGA